MGILTILSDSTIRTGNKEDGFIIERIKENPTLQDLINGKVDEDYLMERLQLRKNRILK